MQTKILILTAMVSVFIAAMPGCGGNKESKPTLSVTVNDGGTHSYVQGFGISCGDNGAGSGISPPQEKCSVSIDGLSGQLIGIYMVPVGGTDDNGNFDTVGSWSGCPQVNSYDARTCNIPSGSGSVHPTATFTKVYGLSSNISVTVSGSGTGSIGSDPGNISCSNTA